MPRGRSLPPDPSRPDQLQTLIDQRIEAFLKEPLGYPQEMVEWITSYASLNAIQSVTS